MTAVEFYRTELINLLSNKSEFQTEIEIFNKAKAMEKEQITNAYWDGGQDIPLTEEKCNEYYNETYKK